MSFQPFVPITGYGGWKFLNRTLPQQQETFNKTPLMKRDMEYFRENIAKVASAADLVADRRLLKVALGAFGLDEQIDARALVRKVLEDPFTDPKALSNRFSDPRYKQFAAAFGFGSETGSKVGELGFADKILAKFQVRQFEVALGENDQTMRLALGVRREIAELIESDTNDRAKWLAILGSRPMREVMQTAFGLPDAFVQLNLDKQLDTFRSKARQIFGDDKIEQFSDPDRMEDLVRRFVVRADAKAIMEGGGATSPALQILQSSTFVPLWRDEPMGFWR
jgi:hypothetical protein